MHRIGRRRFVKLGAVAGIGAALPRIASAERWRTRHLVTVLAGDARADLLTGQPERTQRPRHPTWNEVIRRRTGARASELWTIHDRVLVGDCVCDVKNYSSHPDYGIRFGATNLDASAGWEVEKGLGHTSGERRAIESFAEGLTPSSDAMSVALDVVRRFEPRCVTVFGVGRGRALDAWLAIEVDSGLRERTSLVVHDGRSVEVFGPDIHGTAAVRRRELAPMVVAWMTGRALPVTLL